MSKDTSNKSDIFMMIPDVKSFWLLSFSKSWLNWANKCGRICKSISVRAVYSNWSFCIISIIIYFLFLDMRIEVKIPSWNMIAVEVNAGLFITDPTVAFFTAIISWLLICSKTVSRLYLSSSLRLRFFCFFYLYISIRVIISVKKFLSWPSLLPSMNF